jgi:preprotein translocase subunit YajC
VEGIASLFPLILIFVLFYFLVIRRGQRQQQQVRDVQRSITVGQQVMTTAGLYATVSALEDDTVVLEIAPGVNVRYARAAVARDIESIPEATTPEPAPDTTPDTRPDRP